MSNQKIAFELPELKKVVFKTNNFLVEVSGGPIDPEVVPEIDGGNISRNSGVFGVD